MTHPSLITRLLIKKTLPTSLCLTFLLCLQGCNHPSLFIVNNLAKLENYHVSKAIQYGTHSLNQLTVYRPEQSEPARATIIFFYGGCWGGCLSLTREYYIFVAEALTSQGFNVVIPDYRRHPKVKLASIMVDAKSAVEWVSANIHNFGGSNKRIILMGHSAGAHIAALLTFDERYLLPDSYQNILGFIGLAGPYDFLPFTKDYQKKVFGPESNYANTQPINFVDGTEPPALLLYGNDDTTVKVRNIVNFSRKINTVGGRVKTLYYDDIDHTDIIGALSIPLRDDQSIFADIIAFAKQVSED